MLMVATWMPLIVILIAAGAGLVLDTCLRAISTLISGRGWSAAESAVTLLRGVITLYTIALGVYIGSTIYPLGGARGELIEERLAIALFILASTIVGARLAEQCITMLSRHYGERFPSASLFVSIARITVIVIGLLIFLQSLNIAVAPILTVLGTGGVAVALALQSTLANLFAGIQIIAARQVRTGDYIKTEDGSEGYVNDITWRNTTIRDLNGNTIVVPNNKLAMVTFTNYSLPQGGMSVGVDVLIAYGEDLLKAERIALEAAREATQEIGVPGHEPSVQFSKLTENGIVLSAGMDILRFTDRFTARSKFIQIFCTRCFEEHLVLPFQPWASLPPSHTA